MKYTPRSYSFVRRMTTEARVHVHFTPEVPLRAVIYVEGQDGSVLDVWLQSYDGPREMMNHVVERVVFGEG